jgi:hypothetical protein
MQLKYKLIIVGGIFVTGILIGAKFNSTHRVEEKIVYKDRTHTVIKERTTTTPDGTTVIEKETTKDEQKDSIISKIEQKPSQKDWAVGVGYDLFRPVPTWSVQVNRRIIGNFYGGVYGRTDGVIGVGLLYTF